MKSAYELAMERLNKVAPSVKLTAEQKKQIKELESRCAAKIAERELLIQGEITKAMERGEYEEIDRLQKQLGSDKRTLQADLEEKKQGVRGG